MISSVEGDNYITEIEPSVLRTKKIVLLSHYVQNRNEHQTTEFCFSCHIQSRRLTLFSLVCVCVVLRLSIITVHLALCLKLQHESRKRNDLKHELSLVLIAEGKRNFVHFSPSSLQNVLETPRNRKTVKFFHTLLETCVCRK